MPSQRLLVSLLALITLAAPATSAKEPVVADATTRTLLRRAEFEQISISPDGKLLAIARRMPNSSVVTLHKREDMTPVISFDPGNLGEITTLYWIDNERLVIGATRVNPAWGFAWREPSLLIVRTDGKDTFELPGNFVAAIDGDPDHLLVETCGFSKGRAGCNIPEIRKNDIRKLIRKGELVIAGPPDTRLIPDSKGNARFAFGMEDDGTGRTYVLNQAKDGWTLINDGSKTHLEVFPLGVARDGLTGYLQVQRKQGTDAIERYDFATGQRTPLYANDDSDPVGFRLSADGKDYIGAVYRPTDPRVRFWRPDDPEAKASAEVQAAFPDRLAAVVSTSKDGNLAVVSVWSDHDPGAFYLVDRLARKATIIAREKPWIDPAEQATQKGFALEARDGLNLHGVLTLPPKSSGKNLPLVVLPHGGPYEVMDAWGYDPEVQILAQHGYAVLQVNFRGSGGYGRQFMERGERQWGRAMQDDVTDATHWAIAQGIADPQRICIYGASYGGYAALMGPIREPGLYRCAVGLSGVFDLAKMYKWGSIRRSDYGQIYLKRVLGEDQAELAANSPAKLADKIGVPVLLAHGTLDARVDIKQAQLMKRELNRRKMPVELIEYSTTGHSIALEAHQLDFYTRLLTFLGTYIGPGVAAVAATPPPAQTGGR